jgi:hypothetical protein
MSDLTGFHAYDSKEATLDVHKFIYFHQTCCVSFEYFEVGFDLMYLEFGQSTRAQIGL